MEKLIKLIREINEEMLKADVNSKSKIKEIRKELKNIKKTTIVKKDKRYLSDYLSFSTKWFRGKDENIDNEERIKVLDWVDNLTRLTFQKKEMDKKEFKDQIKSIKNNLKDLKKTTKDNRLRKFIGVILSGGGPVLLALLLALVLINQPLK